MICYSCRILIFFKFNFSLVYIPIRPIYRIIPRLCIAQVHCVNVSWSSREESLGVLIFSTLQVALYKLFLRKPQNITKFPYSIWISFMILYVILVYDQFNFVEWQNSRIENEAWIEREGNNKRRVNYVHMYILVVCKKSIYKISRWQRIDWRKVSLLSNVFRNKEKAKCKLEKMRKKSEESAS